MTVASGLPQVLTQTTTPDLPTQPKSIPATSIQGEREKKSSIDRSMEAGGGADGVDILASTPAAVASQWSFMISQRFQHLLDKSTPHIRNRWIAFIVIAFAYIIRVYFVQGFYIISYGLGIYILNLLIAFLSPQVDPEIQELTDGPTLPTRGSDEFRPFVRRLPEFKFWYSLTKAFCIAFVMTFFSVFDVPVFWPILLFYWFVLFSLTMRRQIHHMIRYKYVPFSFGKKQYSQKRPVADESATLVRE